MTPQLGGQWWQSRTLLLQLLHSAESTASTEQLNLGPVEGVVQEDDLLGPVGMLDDAFQGLVRSKVLQTLVSLSMG